MKVWYVLAFLLPVVGIIAGIVALARNQVGPGFALWGTAFLGFLSAIALSGYLG